MSSGKFAAADPRPLALRVRKFLGQSQDGFAKLMAVSKASVQNWESQRGRPSPPTLRKMAELAPPFAEELRSVIDHFEYHRKPAGSRRYSEETTTQLHEALDIILDRAPSTAIQQVSALLERFAGTFGDREELPAPLDVPDDLSQQVRELARGNKLDTSYILREALTLGLSSLSPASADWRALGKRQAKISKEAQQRVESRGKTK